jgi:hypothetical protein
MITVLLQLLSSAVSAVLASKCHNLSPLFNVTFTFHYHPCTVTIVISSITTVKRLHVITDAINLSLLLCWISLSLS